MGRRRANKSRKLTSYLPPEIIEAFLLKSSVKPLLRFKSVSKSWNALISDPVFVRNHPQESISSNPQNLFLYKFSSSNKLSFVKLENGKLQTLEEKPKGLPRGLKRVIWFGEGVLLVTDASSSSRYVLFNPSTRTHIELVMMPNQFYIHKFICGICRDPTTGYFKVVVLVSPNCYAVYSCKNKSWTKREPLTITHPIHWRLGVSVNGAIYWLRYLNNNDHTRVITYFDPRDDTLKILPMPKDVGDNKWIFLAGLRSSLCLYCNGEDKTTVRIWTKEKGIDNNSWKEMMTIRNVRIPIWSFEPQCFLGNKLLIRYEDCAELMVYSPFEKTFERFEDTKLNRSALIPYVDNLFSPTTNTRRKRKRKGRH